MANVKYHPEDVLVEKFQSGEYGWLDYINHHSPEWQQEYTAFCMERHPVVNDESAEEFVDWKGEQIDAGEQTHKSTEYVYQIKFITSRQRPGSRTPGDTPS